MFAVVAHAGWFGAAVPVDGGPRPVKQAAPERRVLAHREIVQRRIVVEYPACVLLQFGGKRRHLRGRAASRWSRKYRNAFSLPARFRAGQRSPCGVDHPLRMTW